MIREGAMPDSAPQDPSTLPPHGLDTKGGQSRTVSISIRVSESELWEIVWPDVVYKHLVNVS